MSTAVARDARWDGMSAEDLRSELGLPDVRLFDEIGSTLDEAHHAAARGAPDGTLVLADRQLAGRGRAGRSWQSEGGAGIWATFIARPHDPAALEVLSVRVGLALAPALDAFANGPVRLKWPNDLLVGDAKVGGILIETRWRGSQIDWVAIGVGVNVTPPRMLPEAAGLRAGTSRVDVVRALVAAVSNATARTGHLTTKELAEYRERDATAGRRCVEPARGVVRGIDAEASLLVQTDTGTVAVRTGSLRLDTNA